MDFSTQEYWSGLSFPTVREHPDPGIKTESLASPALAGWLFTTMPPRKPYLRVAAFNMSPWNPCYFGRATDFSVYIRVNFTLFLLKIMHFYFWSSKNVTFTRLNLFGLCLLLGIHQIIILFISYDDITEYYYKWNTPERSLTTILSFRKMRKWDPERWIDMPWLV